MSRPGRYYRAPMGADDELIPDPVLAEPMVATGVVELDAWHDWLLRACVVLQTVALVIIAIALVAD